MPNEIATLLALLDSCFNQRSWHGPNLRGSIRGLSPQQAVRRPRPNRHSIAEQTLHAAYWKYVVRRRILREKRGSFPLKGSNWFPVTPSLSATEWKQMIQLLEEQHAALRAAIATLAPADLPRKPSGSTVTNFAIITGIAAHDVYHAGQIQLLKRLQSVS